MEERRFLIRKHGMYLFKKNPKAVAYRKMIIVGQTFLADSFSKIQLL